MCILNIYLYKILIIKNNNKFQLFNNLLIVKKMKFLNKRNKKGKFVYIYKNIKIYDF